MPAKLAEYLAVGRAVVVSRVGDIPDYLVDRQDVLFCKPGDPHSLASTLQQLLQNRLLRKALAANARSAAQRNFDYHKVIARLGDTMAQGRASKAMPIEAEHWNARNRKHTR
jgi:glycosyltransferase involved in cell wall biosynthesis